METIVATATIAVALALFIGVYSTLIDLYKHAQNPDTNGYVSAGKNKHFKVVPCDCLEECTPKDIVSEYNNNYWEFKNEYREDRWKGYRKNRR